MSARIDPGSEAFANVPISTDRIYQSGEIIPPIIQEQRDYDTVRAEWRDERNKVIIGHFYGALALATTLTIEGCVAAEALPSSRWTHIVAAGSLAGSVALFKYGKKSLPKVQILAAERTREFRREARRRRLANF